MTAPKPPELFAERPVRSDFARSGPSYAVRRIVTVLVLSAFVGGGVYWWLSRPAQTTPSEIPTIKGESTYKQRPQQPGGLDIPHQDVQVYQSIDNDRAPKQEEVEHLLPPPETPQAPAATVMAAPPPAPALESLMPEPKKIETTVAAPNAAPVAAVAPAPVAPPAAQPVAPPVPQTAPAVAPVVAVPPAASAPMSAPKTINDVLKDVAAQAKTKPAVPVQGGTIIQLAAIQDQDAAEALKTKLQAKHAPILGAASLRVIKADLGAKGIYYRIQSQPLAEEQAKTICAALKNANAGCILVRP